MTVRKTRERSSRKVPLKMWIIAAQSQIHPRVGLGLKHRNASYKGSLWAKSAVFTTMAGWKLREGAHKFLHLPHGSL